MFKCFKLAITGLFCRLLIVFTINDLILDLVSNISTLCRVLKSQLLNSHINQGSYLFVQTFKPCSLGRLSALVDAMPAGSSPSDISF